MDTQTILKEEELNDLVLDIAKEQLVLLNAAITYWDLTFSKEFKKYKKKWTLRKLKPNWSSGLRTGLR